MSLNSLKKMAAGGELENDETTTPEAVTSAMPATTTPAKKISPLAQQAGNFNANPELAKARDERARAYYEKQIADAKRENEGFGSFTGIDTVLGKYGLSPTGQPNGQNIIATKLAAKKAEQEGIAGLGELDTLKAAQATRGQFDSLMNQARVKEQAGDKAGAEMLRNQALSLDPTMFGAHLAPSLTQADINLKNAQAFKAQNEPNTKGQLTDIQRITAEEKLDEAKTNVENIKDNIKQSNTFEKEVKSLALHPGLERATGVISGRTPTFLSKDAKDFENLLESVKSKVFLANVNAMKGMGALSNAEGDKIAQAQAALALSLSPDEMRKQLKIIQETYERGSKKQKELLKSAERRARQTEGVLSGDSRGAIPPAAKPSAPKPAPAVGAVINGYRFLGGDPNLESSYEKA